MGYSNSFNLSIIYKNNTMEAIKERNRLSSMCYNQSIAIRNEFFIGNGTLKDLKELPELENCFGWKYFEYSYIISIVQIGLGFFIILSLIYILLQIESDSRITKIEK